GGPAGPVPLPEPRACRDGVADPAREHRALPGRRARGSSAPAPVRGPGRGAATSDGPPVCVPGTRVRAGDAAAARPQAVPHDRRCASRLADDRRHEVRPARRHRGGGRGALEAGVRDRFPPRRDVAAGRFVRVHRDGGQRQEPPRVRNMTSLREFLDELARVDVRVWADGETLRCSGPADVVTPELQAQLRARKAEILAFLGQARAATMGGDWTPAPRPGRLPLSEGQERLWRLAELQPASGAYITTTVFRLEGDLDVAAMERSLDELQRRHEILRTSFPSDGGDPVQRIAPPAAWRL